MQLQQQLRPIEIKGKEKAFKKFTLYLGYFMMLVILGLIVYFFIKILT